MAPDGSSRGQRTVLITRAAAWANSIRASNLNMADIWRAYMVVLWPGLTYPLAASSLSITDLKLVQQKVSKIIHNSLHLNKCILKLLLFLQHMHTNDDISKQLLISIGFTHLELGQDVKFFCLSFGTYRHLITDTWVTHLWEFLSASNIQLQHAPSVSMWSPNFQRENDLFPVDNILRPSFNPTDQHILNKWRMHLLTVADIATSNGLAISSDVYYGQRSPEQTSCIQWPEATQLHASHLQVWWDFLDCLTDGRSLLAPRGGWLPACSPHKCWNFRLDPCSGLWKYNDTLSTFLELKPYAPCKLA